MVASGDDGQAITSITATERALLLALLLKWKKDSYSFKVEQARELEKKIWLSHIRSAIEQEEEKEPAVSDNQQVQVHSSTCLLLAGSKNKKLVPIVVDHRIYVCACIHRP